MRGYNSDGRIERAVELREEECDKLRAEVARLRAENEQLDALAAHLTEIVVSLRGRLKAAERLLGRLRTARETKSYYVRLRDLVEDLDAYDRLRAVPRREDEQ
jgi:predicted  nucleic acid-binding Zn-ribbon protein